MAPRTTKNPIPTTPSPSSVNSTAKKTGGGLFDGCVMLVLGRCKHFPAFAICATQSTHGIGRPKVASQESPDAQRTAQRVHWGTFTLFLVRIRLLISIVMMEGDSIMARQYHGQTISWPDNRAAIQGKRRWCTACSDAYVERFFAGPSGFCVGCVGQK